MDEKQLDEFLSGLEGLSSQERTKKIMDLPYHTRLAFAEKMHERSNKKFPLVNQLVELMTLNGMAAVGRAALDAYPMIEDREAKAYLACGLLLRAAVEMAECFGVQKQFEEAYFNLEPLVTKNTGKTTPRKEVS